MISIHICEDDPTILTFLQKKITDICMIEDYDFTVETVTTSPQEIVAALSSNPRQGIYFLDVDLKDETMNGFELGKQIRSLDTRGFIVYVTSHSELLTETFKYRLETLDYIPKEDEKHMLKRIALCLADINERCKNDKREKKEFFAVQRMNETSYVPLEDIVYFETSTKKHVLNLVAEGAFIEFYGKLADIQEQLGEAFVRTHRSYLVNRSFISGINKQKKLIQLTNGNTVLLSRTKKNEILALLEE